MPAKTCGRRNISPRYWLVEASLAPGKTRMGNLQLPPQIHDWDTKNMLVNRISWVQRNGGGILAEWERQTVHASYFNTGSVTFVGNHGMDNINVVYTSKMLRGVLGT